MHCHPFPWPPSGCHQPLYYHWLINGPTTLLTPPSSGCHCKTEVEVLGTCMETQLWLSVGCDTHHVVINAVIFVALIAAFSGLESLVCTSLMVSDHMLVL